MQKKQKAKSEGSGNSLSKFLAQAGVESRRKVVDIIKRGMVTVNGETVREPGFKLVQTDVVRIGEQKIKQVAKIHILLNKPKDYITTLSDERGRKTVMELLPPALAQKVYPVGRLDRNSTGLLLLTNDGELAQKLSHPKFGILKAYHVQLDKSLIHQHVVDIENGVHLEEGKVFIDRINFIVPGKKDQVELVLHSGQNRVVRRLFEHLGYKVKKLDRVFYAGLTKQGLKNGEWRYLEKDELATLLQNAS